MDPEVATGDGKNKIRKRKAVVAVARKLAVLVALSIAYYDIDVR